MWHYNFSQVFSPENSAVLVHITALLKTTIQYMFDIVFWSSNPVECKDCK